MQDYRISESDEAGVGKQEAGGRLSNGRGQRGMVESGRRIGVKKAETQAGKGAGEAGPRWGGGGETWGSRMLFRRAKGRESEWCET